MNTATISINPAMVHVLITLPYYLTRHTNAITTVLIVSSLVIQYNESSNAVVVAVLVRVLSVC